MCHTNQTKQQQHGKQLYCVYAPNAPSDERPGSHCGRLSWYTGSMINHTMSVSPCLPHTHAHTRVHTRTHAHIRTHTREHTRTYAQTRTHARTHFRFIQYPPPPQLCCKTKHRDASDHFDPTRPVHTITICSFVLNSITGIPSLSVLMYSAG